MERLGVLLVCLLIASPVTATVIQSAHYQFYSDGPTDEAKEFSQVLESAWPQFASFFDGEPKVSRKKLVVRFFENKETWRKAMADDGHIETTNAGGRYWTDTKTAYFHRQPSPYYTRCLLLHEAAHQFHYLSCGLGNNVEKWYIEGVAEHLANHHWDGDSLKLGQTGLSLENYPKKALESLTSTPRPLVAMIENQQENRPLGMMLVRYLITTQPKKYSRFTRSIEKGNDAQKIFRRYFGKISDFAPQFSEWVTMNQEPLKIVFNEWERLQVAEFKGSSTNVVSLAVFPETVSLAQCAMPVPKEGRSGVVLSFQDATNYTVALLSSDGRLAIQARENNNWRKIDSSDFEIGDEVQIAVKRDVSGIQLMINGDKLGPYSFPHGRLGLAVDSSEVHFKRVSWNG